MTTFERKIIFNVVFALMSFVLSGAALLANPLIYQKYTADPTASWFNSRMYIYCSHDITGQTGYNMNNFTLISSDDLVNWTDEGEPATISGALYAPDSIFRNNYYYVYYGNGGGSISVFRSTSPTGPFTDPLGHAMITSSTAGVAPITYTFDPAAFIDDDGQAYMYFGGGGPGNARVIKLNSDMISVSGSAVSIDAYRYFEAPFMNKVNGTYYFSYSSDFSASPAASIDYLTSSNPMTGFTHRGTVLYNPPNNCGNNNHASIVNIGTDYYMAYHNRALAILDGLTCAGNAVYQRSVNLDRLYFNSDGTIAVVTPTTAGVTKLKNQNPYTTLRAVMMAQESGIQTIPCSEGGMAVTNIENGDWIKVRNLDFGSGAATFTARVASANSGGSIQVRLDSATGTLVGTCSVPNTGGASTWQSVSCPVSGATGLHDVYFVFAGGSGTLFSFEWYVFTSSGPTATPTRTLSPTYTPTPVISSSWRVNAGGPAYTDTVGNLWAADENYSGGSTVASGGAVTGTSDSTLYDTQRYGSSFSYSFNVPAGSYQVTLKFAETYSGDYSTGARIFNVAINGVTLSTNMDIYAQVGSDTVDDKIYNNVSPSGGVITIQFTGTSSTDTSAVVEALQVIPMPATATFTPTRTSTATTTRTLSPTLTSTATFTRTATSTMTSTSTSTFTPTSTATRTATPSATPTDTATRTATYTFTSTATASSTSSPTATSTRTNTATSTTTTSYTPSDSPTRTSTPTSTATMTSTVTRTNTPTSTPTSSSTASSTSSWTATSTSTYTGVPSATETHSNTPTATPTQTNTAVPSTSIPTSSSTPTWTSTPTSTSSNTASSTVTSTVTATNTVVFTATMTTTSTSTNTALPQTSTSSATATDTGTSSATATCTMTSTSAMTATSTPTDSPVPSATPTLTWTSTFSSTLTETDTATASSTRTSTPSQTATSTLSSTSTVTLTSSPTVTWTTTQTGTATSTVTVSATSTAVPTNVPSGCPAVTMSAPYPNPSTCQACPVRFDLMSTCPKTLLWTISTSANRRVVSGTLSVFGRGTLVWNQRDDRGKPVANGLYYFRLFEAGQPDQRAKILILH